MAAAGVMTSVGRSAIIVIVVVIPIIGTAIRVITTAVVWSGVRVIAIVWATIVAPIVVIAATIGVITITGVPTAVIVGMTCLRRTAGKEDQTGRKNQTGNKSLHSTLHLFRQNSRATVVPDRTPPDLEETCLLRRTDDP
jgi:hypothetical protein